MVTDEASRLRLYAAARDALGQEAADTLMQWLRRDMGELVTRHELRTLETKLERAYGYSHRGERR